MENYKAKRILVSSHPKKLAEEVKSENPKDIVHFFYDSEDRSFESNDLAFKDYDYLFLTDEDYALISSKLLDLGTSHLCVIYTDLESEFFLIPPGKRIDSYCFGLFEDWLAHINAVLHPAVPSKLTHHLTISRNSWDKNFDMAVLLPQLFAGEKISKHLEENIKFVLRELISNSFVHTKSPMTVVEFEKRSLDVFLRVTDFQGEFPKSRFISTLFRQKRVVEPSTATKGAGIGLFLVAQIANELHIKTCSRGTSIEVAIPLRKISGQASFHKKILSHQNDSELLVKLIRKEFYSTSVS
jgi:anti-sigma regulatory factor (Ser/Thr protein kinase)